MKNWLLAFTVFLSFSAYSDQKMSEIYSEWKEFKFSEQDVKILLSFLGTHSSDVQDLFKNLHQSEKWKPFANGRTRQTHIHSELPSYLFKSARPNISISYWLFSLDIDFETEIDVMKDLQQTIDQNLFNHIQLPKALFVQTQWGPLLIVENREFLGSQIETIHGYSLEDRSPALEQFKNLAQIYKLYNFSKINPFVDIQVEGFYNGLINANWTLESYVNEQGELEQRPVIVLYDLNYNSQFFKNLLNINQLFVYAFPLLGVSVLVAMMYEQ